MAPQAPALAADYYPPGLEPASPPEEVVVGEGVSLQRRTLLPQDVRALAAALRGCGRVLAALPISTILRALAETHARWHAALSEERAQAVSALTAVTGYPASALDGALRNLFGYLDAGEMEGWLRAGGVVPEWLDTSPSLASGVSTRDTLVFGPGLTAVVSSGNIPGVAIPSVAQALLLKSPCLVKSSSSEPLLLPLYARSLARTLPELGRALAVVGWNGQSRELDTELAGGTDALMVYGGNTALRELRAGLPAHGRFVGYGHRISFSAFGRERLRPNTLAETAARAARDLCLFDQQGCMSPQTLYVERGGAVSAEEFGAALAGALAEEAQALPRRALVPAEAARIHQYRASMEMRSLSVAGVRLWSSAGNTEWTVAVDPTPGLSPCCLNRTAVIHLLDSLDLLPEILTPHRGLLMTAALDVGEDRLPVLARALGAAGVTRICAVGDAQHPKGALHHDGINAIGTLARFVRVERG